MSKKDSSSTINWMYEGPQSLVNREDYLTGKKLDRNFELYNSDFKETPSAIDNVINKSTSKYTSRDDPAHKTSILLDLDTIKKEDPLVAIKVKEEKIRREILENPMKMKRLQAIVMSAMEKKMKKLVKRRLSSSSPPKKRKKRDDSSSDDELASRGRRIDKSRQPNHKSSNSRSRDYYQKEKQYKIHHKSNSSSDNRKLPSRKEEMQTKRRHDSSSNDEQRSRRRIAESKTINYKSSNSRDQKEKHNKSNSMSDNRRKSAKESPRKEEKETKKRHDSSFVRKVSKNEAPPKEKRSKKRHDSTSSSSSTVSSSSSSQPRTRPGYGLVYVNNNSKPSTSNRIAQTVRKSPSPVKKPLQEKPKQKLTEKEKEEKRREMMDNAKWREEQRHTNQQKYKKQVEEEEKRNNDRSKPADFIRPILSDVVDKSSVEERIKSKKQTIQRRHNAMDSNFARK